ncbi:MAG: nucleotidyltransferase domain-containing protein [Synechococcales cyanobacterium C42_A2020_086]|nr:nucleotidyltransferase domain-containing protein [Synechococcales cyanobacterium M58_A2018_015]MBF2073126.1 nucleotidyltransferase domain-containing protein [Synechococcales cyanobacterium C42_A2020_086]
MSGAFGSRERGRLSRHSDADLLIRHRIKNRNHSVHDLLTI